MLNCPGIEGRLARLRPWVAFEVAAEGHGDVQGSGPRKYIAPAQKRRRGIEFDGGVPSTSAHED